MKIKALVTITSVCLLLAAGSVGVQATPGQTSKEDTGGTGNTGTGGTGTPTPGPSPIAGELQSISATPPQQEIGAVIELVCPSGLISDADFQARCDEVVEARTSDVTGVRDGLQAMATEENSAVRTTIVDVANAQLEGVGARLAALRGATATVPGRVIMNFDGNALFGGAAGADDAGFGRLGFFLTGNYTVGDREATARETGFDFDIWGVTAGMDYRFTGNFVMGVAYSYSNTDAELEKSAGELDTDAHSVSIYGTYNPTPASYFDVVLGWGWSDHDQERSINYSILGTSVDQTAKADIDSNQFFISATGGYNFYVSEWTLNPYVRGEFVKVDVDEFSERLSNPAAAGSGLGLRVDDQEFTSKTLSLGGQVARAFSMGWGVLVPQIHAEYIHEFDNDNDAISGSFLGDTSGTTFFISTDDPDRNYGVAGIGASAIFAHGRSAFVQYQALLGYEELDSHAVTAGLRLEF